FFAFWQVSSVNRSAQGVSGKPSGCPDSSEYHITEVPNVIWSSSSGARDSPVSANDSRPILESAPAKKPKFASPEQSENSGALIICFTPVRISRPITD